MANNLLQDSQGNTSSKRVAGFIALGVAFVLTGMGLLKPAATVEPMLYAWLSFATAALLGGVFERRGPNE